jgi:membrane-associated phospholipid phosphatase
MVERDEGLRTMETAPAFAFKVSMPQEGGLLAAAVAVTLFGYAIGGRIIKRRCPPCDPATINRFDRGAVRWHNQVLGPLSYVIEVAAIATPPIVTLCDRGLSRELAEDLWVYAETFALSSILNIAIKTWVQRPVPRLYAGLYLDLDSQTSSYRSFYSGHTAQVTNALAANAVMSHLRGRRRHWTWTLAGIGTVAVSLARVGAGRHFYSDVAAGALAGGIVGSLVPLLHPAEPSAPRVQPLPGLA